MDTRTGQALGILAAALLASAAHAADTTFDRRLSVTPGGHLKLDADAGSVTVAGHAGNELVIHAQVSGSEEFVSGLKINVEQTAAGVGITARRARTAGFHWFGSSHEDVHFTIDVPRDYSVELRTAGGDLEIRDVQGSVAMHTSGGNIDATGLTGAIEIRTSGGNVTVADCSGALDAETSGGDISLHNVSARVSAETSGGDVSAEVRSNRGVDLGTSGGSITLLLAPAVAATIDARTSGGAVTSALALTISGKSGESRLRGTVNGGGEPVTLHTSGGDIHIGPLP